MDIHTGALITVEMEREGSEGEGPHFCIEQGPTFVNPALLSLTLTVNCQALARKTLMPTWLQLFCVMKD